MPDPDRQAVALSVAAFTDTGQTRKHNEDFVAYHVPNEPAIRDSHGALLVVCDGVGGGAAGEVASQHAVRRILNDYYQAAADQSPLDRLAAAARQANADIHDRNQSEPDGRRMTTTVVAAVVLGTHAFLVHAGDSRAYLVRGGRAAQITQDHSWVAEMVRGGDLTPEEAAVHPWRNRITRALGTREDVDLERQTLELAPGDRLVLCTDGLTRHVSDAEIAEIAAGGPAQRTAQWAAQRLVNLANQRGGIDNISVIVAELASPAAVIPAVRGAGAAAKRSLPVPALIAAVVGVVAIVAVALVLLTGDGLFDSRSTPTPALPAAPPLIPTVTLAPAALPVVTPTPSATVAASMTPQPSATLKPTLTDAPTRTRTLTPRPAATPTWTVMPVIQPPEEKASPTRTPLITLPGTSGDTGSILIPPPRSTP